MDLEAMLGVPTPTSHPHLPWTFVTCWGTLTKREEHYVIAQEFVNADEADRHTRRWHRGWEYRSHEPWDQKTHGHRQLFPVPVQNVNFFVKKLDLVRPEPRRTSVFIKPNPKNVLFRP